MANPYVKQTWTDNVSALSAARLGVIETGIYDAHIQPAARVFHNANQAIANITLAQLAFNSERYDQDGLGTSTIHDNVTNNSRLTCRVAGKYQIGACVSWDVNATGVRQIGVYLNGATVVAWSTAQAVTVAATPTIQVVTCDYDLAVNDYVQVIVFHSAGGALNAGFAANYSPEFWMHRVG